MTYAHCAPHALNACSATLNGKYMSFIQSLHYNFDMFSVSWLSLVAICCSMLFPVFSHFGTPDRVLHCHWLLPTLLLIFRDSNGPSSVCGVSHCFLLHPSLQSRLIMLTHESEEDSSQTAQRAHSECLIDQQGLCLKIISLPTTRLVYLKGLSEM